MRYDRSRGIEGKEGSLRKGSRHKYQKDISTKKKKKKKKKKKSEQCNYLYKLNLLRQACGGIYALFILKN